MAEDFYRLLVRTQGFNVEALTEKTPPFRWRTYSLKQIVKKIKKGRYRLDEMSGFDLAIIILSSGSEAAGKFLALVSESKSHNLVYEPKRAIKHLEESFELRVHKDDKPKVKEKIKMDAERLYDLFSEAFTPIRQKLGWGDGGDVEKCYHITDDVIEVAATPESTEYLEMQSTRYPYIFPDRLQAITNELQQNFLFDAKQIIRALKATGNRRHFASLSLTDERGELMVCLANHHKDCLRVEAWKFALLLESPKESKMLAQLERLDYREKRHPFVFNKSTHGDVHAMFLPERSVIHVICKHEDVKKLDDKATFYIEPDYALSLYLLLKRVRQDKEQFTRLWEEATTEPKDDLFDSLYIQH